jgi:hypothetical protein
METFNLELHLEKERAKKRRIFNAAGFEIHVCTTCGKDEVLCLTFEHTAGRKHDDTTTLVCWNCKAERDAFQRAEPSGGDDPRNPFEVIGRWLLGLAAYFAMLVPTLTRFGEWLINIAKAGHGADLCIE